MPRVLRRASGVRAGYGAADRIFGILFIATNGLGIGLTTMIGQALGADMKGRARELMRRGIQALFVILIFETIFLYLLREPLVTFFVPHSPGAIEQGMRFIELFALGMPLLGVFFAAEAVYRGSGWNVPMTVLGVLRLLIRLSFGYVLAFVFNLQADGIWIGMCASNIVIGLISIPFLMSKRWMRARIDVDIDKSSEEPVEA